MNEQPNFIVPPTESYSETKRNQALMRYLWQECDELDTDTKLLAKKGMTDTLPGNQFEKILTVASSWWQKMHTSNIFNPENRYWVTKSIIDRDENTEEVFDIQQRLFETLELKPINISKINDIKDLYIERFTSDKEGVFALFAQIEMLIIQKKIDEHRSGTHAIPNAERKKLFLELTEYHYVCTQHILHNCNDTTYLRNYWQVLEKCATILEQRNQYFMIKSGQLGQVAAHLTLEAIGLKPSLSHPRIDAYSKIDTFVSGGEFGELNIPTQVKSARIDYPALMKGNHFCYPSEVKQLDNEEKLLFFQELNEHSAENNKFYVAINDYAGNPETKVEGYYMLIPKHSIDFYTGKPNEATIDFFRNAINEI